MEPPKVKRASQYGVISVKEINSMAEMSATGTGAAVSAGSGEGVAGKFAFAPAIKVINKKTAQSKSSKSKKLDESLRIKNDAKLIFWESVRWLLNIK